MTTYNHHNIDWAAVAAKARADLGSERIAHFSERLRTRMTAVAVQLRREDGWTDGLEVQSVMDE